jgi:hypothetical protein
VVIDDFEFSSDEMKPFLNDAFGKLFKLLKEVDECDTKVGPSLKCLQKCDTNHKKNNKVTVVTM